MDDEVSSVPDRKTGNERRKPRSGEPAAPKIPRNLESDHRKFMIAMIGLFLVIFLVMVFLNTYMGFSIGGGI